jgi:hypothetical protein
VGHGQLDYILGSYSIQGIDFSPYYLSKNTGSEPEFVNVNVAQESLPPTYLAWRAGTSNTASYRPARMGIFSWSPLKVYKFGLGARIFALLRSPEIDTKKSIPSAHVAQRAGMV